MQSSSPFPVHPFGEGVIPSEITPPESVLVQTPGGAMEVVWEPGTAVTPHGLSVFFIEFLHTSGLWSAFRDTCPLRRSSPNAPSLSTVCGSLLLSVLSGGNRYRHIEQIRGDGVIPQLLGMDRILSADALRHAAYDIAQHENGQRWVSDLLFNSLLPVVRAGPWILDLDSTVVTVYGKQVGSAVGYNPTKLGRPSYSYHTFIIGGLRLPLDVVALPGNESHGIYGAETLWHLLDHRLPTDAQPWCVRGDISYGSDDIITGCEKRQRDYLFKIKKSNGIKAVITNLEKIAENWDDAGHGWHGKEQRVNLMGWSCERRVIILRRLHQKTKKTQRIGIQQSLFIAELCPEDGFEYAVLVTSLKHPIPTVAQFYRDRADSENTFADLKNDWGWGGFTTHDHARNQLMARLVALVYTWWNIYVRQISPLQHREGHVSRPALLHGVAKKITHAGKTTLRMTSIHAHAQVIMTVLTTISTALKQTATQLAHHDAQKATTSRMQPWDNLITRIFMPYIAARAGPQQIP